MVDVDRGVAPAARGDDNEGIEAGARGLQWGDVGGLTLGVRLW